MNDLHFDEAPAGWAEELDIAIAELDRGEFVPSEEVHAMIKAVLKEMEAERAGAEPASSPG